MTRRLVGYIENYTVNVSQINNAHWLLIREYIRDYTKVQAGPLCYGSLHQPNIDSSSQII